MEDGGGSHLRLLYWSRLDMGVVQSRWNGDVLVGRSGGFGDDIGLIFFGAGHS